MINKNEEARAVFRSEYRELTDAELASIDHIKNSAAVMYHLMSMAVEHGADESQIRIAKERLQETVMWAVKGITG